MKKLSNKIGWIALGIAVGLGSNFLLAANQPAAETSDRYDVDLDITIGGGLLTAHDRQENRMLVYHLTDEGGANLAGTIDLNGLGQETLPTQFVDKAPEKPEE